jgi:hypothetical protein
MANLLEKLHLVERKENEDDLTLLSYDKAIETDINSSISMTPEANVNLNEIKVDTLISDIYNENNLADMTKSIFKIQELNDTLPKEMRTDAKRTTVLGILKVSSITVDEVIEDGINRTDILNSVKSQIQADSKQKVTDANAEIESLKTKIEELQKTIALSEAETEQSTKLISDELNGIAELCKFISGGNQ